MFQKFYGSSTIRPALAAVVALGLAALSATSANAQIQCHDNETWQVDRGAIEQVFNNIETYTGTNQPILINLKTLGASDGQLVVVFIEKDLRCARQQYQNSSSSQSGGLVTICKRPRCS